MYNCEKTNEIFIPALIKKIIHYFQYSIKGKAIGFVNEEEQITVFGAKKRKRNLLVADQTSKVEVLMYEGLIDKINEGRSYCFTNLSSRLYQNQYFLTTTPLTQLTQIEDIENIAETHVAVDIKTIEGNVCQVQFSCNLKCASCDKVVELDSADATTVKCQYCRLKAKVSTLKKTYIFRMNLQDEQQIHRLVTFTNCMEAFLDSTGNQELLHNMDQLEDYVLSLDKIKVKIAHSDVISSIELM